MTSGSGRSNSDDSAAVAASTEAAVVRSDADFKPVPHDAILTSSMILTVVMTALDTTIANVALPHMQGELSGTQDEMGWVLTSYIVATAIMIPLGGWLANEF